MRKLVACSVVTFLAVLCVGAAFAQSPEKAAAASTTTAVVLPTVTTNTGPPQNGSVCAPGVAFCVCGAWTTILSTKIQPPGGKDLLITGSAQTGIFDTAANNNTAAASTTSTSENVNIQARVLVTPDGGTASEASPGIVSFDNLIRATTQIATNDQLRQVLEEGGAHSFTWIKQDVAPDVVETLALQKRFCYNNFHAATVGATATSTLSAVIGPRSLTVDQVRLDIQ